jgi:hypothetical protein
MFNISFRILCYRFTDRIPWNDIPKISAEVTRSRNLTCHHIHEFFIIFASFVLLLIAVSYFTLDPILSLMWAGCPWTPFAFAL